MDARFRDVENDILDDFALLLQETVGHVGNVFLFGRSDFKGRERVVFDQICAQIKKLFGSVGVSLDGLR